MTKNNIPLLPHARLMARPRHTRRPAKFHVGKKLPKMHGNYNNRIKIYNQTNTHYKILADNMFRNWFMISYRRHKFFCPISVYTFTKPGREFFL